MIIPAHLPPIENVTQIYENIIQTLVRYGAEKIFVFGSSITGEVNRDSDLDLLVVCQSPPKCTHPRFEVRRAISQVQKSLPVDLLVISPERYREHLKKPFGVYESIFKEGIVVYER